MKIQERITVCEVGLRDGMQIEKRILTVEEKLDIIHKLEDAGVTVSGSLAGTGGCPFVPGAAGNVSTEDIVHMCHEQGIETGIDLDKIIAVGHELEELMGHPGGSFVLRAGKNNDILLEQPKGQLERQDR